jgi:hypothetical protein
MQADISRVFSGFSAYCMANSETTVGTEQYGDMLSGIAHLTPSEAKELYAMIREFLAAHEEPAPDAKPWEYALIAYPVSVRAHA